MQSHILASLLQPTPLPVTFPPDSHLFFWFPFASAIPHVLLVSIQIATLNRFSPNFRLVSIPLEAMCSPITPSIVEAGPRQRPCAWRLRRLRRLRRDLRALEEALAWRFVRTPETAPRKKKNHRLLPVVFWKGVMVLKGLKNILEQPFGCASGRTPQNPWRVSFSFAFGTHPNRAPRLPRKSPDQYFTLVNWQSSA